MINLCLTEITIRKITINKSKVMEITGTEITVDKSAGFEFKMVQFVNSVNNLVEFFV